MAYKANIPQPTDLISDSQDDLLNNFGAINTFVATEHVGFGLSNEGKHKTVTFPQAVAPGAAAATEVGLYVADSGGSPEMFINKTASQIPFTKSDKSASGWSYLPSGLIIQWGTGTIPIGTSSHPITLPMTWPTAALLATATPFDIITADADEYVIGITLVALTSALVTRSATATTAECDFSYIALGY